MISDEDKYKIIEIAKNYGVSKVYLFGSNLIQGNISKDIDIAVEGIPEAVFFKFYSDLIFSLSKPVDLINLKNKTLFNYNIKSGYKIQI